MDLNRTENPVDGAALSDDAVDQDFRGDNEQQSLNSSSGSESSWPLSEEDTTSDDGHLLIWNRKQNKNNFCSKCFPSVNNAALATCLFEFEVFCGFIHYNLFYESD